MIKISKITINGYENSYFSDGLLRIGWQMISNMRNVRQTAYRIQIAETETFEEVLWDSGKVESMVSQFVAAEGFNAKHLCWYYVRVMIWENHGEKSPWSQKKRFLYICKEKIHWKAQWVSAMPPLDQTYGGIYIRKKFKIAGVVQKAFLISSAQGMYQPYLDGVCVSDELFLPGWTAYDKRIQYQIWDITRQLNTDKKEHAAGCILAPGWFMGRLGETGQKLYGNHTAWIAQIYLRYEDGREEWIVTDEDCQCHTSALLLADLYDGEIYDARLQIDDWVLADGENKDWLAVKTKNADETKLCPQKIKGVCTHERFEGKIFETPAGEQCIDFGQNMAGVVSFRVKGKPGDKVKFTCFETLNKDGNVYIENLRSAKQTITYYCKGSEEEYYMTRCSYQGFRYVQIHSWPGEIEPSSIQALAVYSDILFHGNFTSSSQLVNRLVENIRWSMKSNFVDIPTDCPQRDERLGWTGDAQIFSETAVYLANVFGFYEKWLWDVAAEQHKDGGVPHLVPDILKFEDQSDDWLLSQGTHSAAAWADAIVLIPWRLYQYYGNKEILESFYNHMKRWIDFMWQHSEGYLWNYKLQFGDWLALDAPAGSYFGATPNELTCTAYFAYSTDVFHKIAKVLGRKEDCKIYGNLYKEVRQAFCRHFLGEDGLICVKTQTALAMSLHFNLIPGEYIGKNAAELKKMIQDNGNYMTTGFMGTPCILAALSENGFVEEAYDLLLREEYPSWLYQVKKGATTVWEHLDGMKPDGSMWSSDMNSFNHYAYGAVAAWLFNQAAGIKSIEDTPGFTRFLVQPGFSKKLPKGCARVETPYGEIEVCWEYQSENSVLKIQIPPNTQAEILMKPEINILNSDLLQFEIKDGYKSAVAGSGIYIITFGINKGTI